VSLVAVACSEQRELAGCKKVEPLGVAAGFQQDGKDGSSNSGNGGDGSLPELPREKGYRLVAAGNSFPVEEQVPWVEHKGFPVRASDTAVAGYRGALVVEVQGEPAWVGMVIESPERERCQSAAWRVSPLRSA